MKKIVPAICVCLFLIACKKGADKIEANNKSRQLYPLEKGSKWIYIDSFFDYYNDYYGFDTF